MYTMTESLISVVSATLHLLIIVCVCTVLNVRSCIKLKKFTKLMKVIISYWIVWIYTVIVTMYSDRIGWGLGLFSEFSLFVHSHPGLMILWSIICYLDWLYVGSMPWVILTWQLIKKANSSNK